jgi:hypothetical protein
MRCFAAGASLLLTFCASLGAQPMDSITMLSRAGRLQEAAGLARAAAEQAPDDPQANLRAGGILVRLAQYDHAMPYLERVRSLSHADAWQQGWARTQLARARLGLGDTVVARSELAELLGMDFGRNTQAEAAALLSKVGGHPALDEWSFVRTVHLRVHFPPHSRVEDRLAFAARMESAYRRLREFFGELPGVADLYIWNSSVEAEAAMFRPLGFARPEYLLVHMRPEQTPGHELTHLFSVHAGSTTRRTRFIDEGTSVAFNLVEANRMREARQAMRMTGTREVSVARFWDDREAVPELLLYPVAGAFVERLIARRGREPFMRLLQRQTLEEARAIYGEELDSIIRDFERELNRR